MIRIPPSIKPGDTIGIAAPSFGATTVTLEVNVYLLVLPVFFAVKLTLIAAGLFSSVAVTPRTVTTVPALLFFFPVKFFDFDDSAAPVFRPEAAADPEIDGNRHRGWWRHFRGPHVPRYQGLRSLC